MGDPDSWVTDPALPGLLELIAPASLGRPGNLFSSNFSSFLLTAVALLSSYSIHLLLKSSGIVGEPQIWPVAGRGGLGQALLTAS